MIRQILTWARDKYAGRPTTAATGAGRSPHWSTVRDKHLKTEPRCAYCGGVKNLEVHHIAPFHLHPEEELDDANLITLCESPGVNCHLERGHLGNWKRCNPYIVEDCRAHRRQAVFTVVRGANV